MTPSSDPRARPRRSGGAVVGVLLVFGIACERAPAPTELRPLQRFVAERSKQGDDPSMAAVPTAIYGGVRRPVLGGGYLTAPFVVPAGARLRFGVGIDQQQLTAESPARFVLAVSTPNREVIVFDNRVVPPERLDDRHWDDHELPLDDYVNRRISLRFESIAEPDANGNTSSVPVWSDPTIYAPVTTEPRHRNVVLISLDTLRADHLGCYGYRRPTSPTIDAEVAGRGTLFEHAYTAFPSTSEAHMTMLTSLYPCTHGGSLERALRPDAHTLAELLRSAGYETAAFTEDANVTARIGFARGFGTFVEDQSLQFLGRKGVGDQTLHLALEWIRAHPRGPWFVFIHTYQVHHPYRSPAGYVEQVAWDAGTDRGAVDAAHYDGAIRYTDDLLAKFLADLTALGVGDDLILVLTGDHGEHLGEGGLFRHGNSLTDILLHVPLVIRARGLAPAAKRVGTPVGLVDLVPTVLDLVGLPPPRWTQGKSLVPLLSGKGMDARELYAGPLGDDVMVRTNDVKWIIDGKTGQGRSSAADGDGPLPDSLGDTLTADAALAHYRTACAALSPPPVQPTGAEADPKLREKLRALGYTN